MQLLTLYSLLCAFCRWSSSTLVWSSRKICTIRPRKTTSSDMRSTSSSSAINIWLSSWNHLWTIRLEAAIWERNQTYSWHTYRWKMQVMSKARQRRPRVTMDSIQCFIKAYAYTQQGQGSTTWFSLWDVASSCFQSSVRVPMPGSSFTSTWWCVYCKLVSSFNSFLSRSSWRTTSRLATS